MVNEDIASIEESNAVAAREEERNVHAAHLKSCEPGAAGIIGRARNGLLPYSKGSC